MAELATLGGGDVAVGRAWVGAAADAQPRAAVEAPCPAGPLDVLCADLWTWLRSGFDAAVLLLDTDAQSRLLAPGVLTVLAPAARAAGVTLGVSWQLIGGSTSRGPLGSLTQLEPTNQRPCSRLGEPVVHDKADGDAPQQPVVRVSEAPELEQLLAAIACQLDAGGKADDAQRPALVLRVMICAGDGQPGATLHVLQLGGAAAERQQLLKLLCEVADLHQRRREGERASRGA